MAEAPLKSKALAIGGIVAGVLLICYVMWLAWRPVMPDEEASAPAVRADRVEVLHFHATQQCWSCETAGKFARRTVEERFAAEVAASRVVFRDINGELPENVELVRKFGATGSSVFLNAIYDGQDHIEQDATVWRLIYNEPQFIEYLEGRIRRLLGE